MRALLALAFIAVVAIPAVHASGSLRSPYQLGLAVTADGSTIHATLSITRTEDRSDNIQLLVTGVLAPTDETWQTSASQGKYQSHTWTLTAIEDGFWRIGANGTGYNHEWMTTGYTDAGGSWWSSQGDSDLLAQLPAPQVDVRLEGRTLNSDSGELRITATPQAGWARHATVRAIITGDWEDPDTHIVGIHAENTSPTFGESAQATVFTRIPDGGNIHTGYHVELQDPWGQELRTASCSQGPVLARTGTALTLTKGNACGGAPASPVDDATKREIALNREGNFEPSDWQDLGPARMDGKHTASAAGFAVMACLLGSAGLRRRSTFLKSRMSTC